MLRRSHKPIRTCLGCQERDMQSTMLRLAAYDGAIVVDLNRQITGRGAYLHRAENCLTKFVRSKVKEFRSLRRGIPPDERRAIVNRIAESI